MATHCVQYSGGVSSWATARLVRDDIMADDDSLILLFADTLIEDRDTYRFLESSAADIGVPVTRLADGRTPFEVFKDKRYLGNSRMDPCSQYLKRDLLRAWIDEHLDPAESVIYIGIDWSETHRLERARPRWHPYRLEAPLIDCRRSKREWLDEAERRGLPRQRLYDMGMPHANCGGGCIKAGIGHWIRLLDAFPERYAEWEAGEEDVRQHIGKDVSIINDRKTGKPLPLAVLRQRHCAQEQFDLFDIGGCGCAID